MSDRSARDGDETEQDWDEVRACHDESYFRWFGCGSKDPLGEKQEWGETRMPEGANYEQEQEILKTEVRGNMAISVVRESGCWRSDSGQVYVRWDHTQGEWKIIAAFFPEVTPRPQS